MRRTHKFDLIMENDNDGVMPLLDHFAELRSRIIKILTLVALVATIAYIITPQAIRLMLMPIEDLLPQDGRLTVLSALGGFTIRFKVSLFLAVIITSPFIVWQVMAFVLPALTKDERKWVVPTVICMVILFLIGMVFCFLVIQRAAFGWLIEQTSDFAVVIPDAEDYLSVMMLLEIGFGVAFELPLFIFYLAILHVVPYRTFRKNWRYIYVVLLVLCAMVTPDASPVTMLLMFAVMVGLYELSLALSRLVIIQRDGKEALGWTRDDYTEHDLNNA